MGPPGARYGVAIRLVRATRWTRPAFAADGIMTALRAEPVPPGCDRLMAFMGRHLGDALWGLFLPQALGAVEAASRMRGYVVARTITLDQLLVSPAMALRHELFHMLGCDHDSRPADCAQQIESLKRVYRSGAAPVWDAHQGWIAASEEARLGRRAAERRLE